MDAILFSFDEKQTDMRDAKKHLNGHSELYWIVGWGIGRDKKLSYPIDGYMHVNGRNVEYKAKIRDIIPYSREHYAGKDAKLFMPEKWIAEWKEDELKENPQKKESTIIITEIDDFFYETSNFILADKKYKKRRIKREPQRGTYVLPPEEST